MEMVKLANQADMIINGYAFFENEECVRVLNLDHPERAAVLKKQGEVIETTMDDIENHIVSEYYIKNIKYLEAAHAEVL